MKTLNEIRNKISYLWFGGKDGWQLTSFHPKDDPAIGWPINGDVRLFIDIQAHAELVNELVEALQLISEEAEDEPTREFAAQTLANYKKATNETT